MIKKLFIALFLGFILLAASPNATPKQPTISLSPVSVNELTAKHIEELKKTTTLFVLRDEDMERIEEFGDALTSVWNITNLQFINHRDMPEYLAEEGYSYFYITTYYYQSQNVTSTWIYLSLVLPKSGVNKKGKTIDRSIYYSRHDLYPDSETMFSAGGYTVYNHASKRKKTSGAENPLYTGGVLRNWQPGILKAYLKEIQINMEKVAWRSIYESIKDKTALNRLKKDTLFIPDYALTEYKPMGGSENNMQDEKDVFGKYPYRYKVLPVKEFDAKIANATKETFFMDYVKSSAQKYVAVISTKDGAIYRNHKPMSYNLKSKDIKAIF